MHIQPQKNQIIRIGSIILASLVLMLIPFQELAETNSICIHYNLFKIQCPLCGMTRAVHEFMHFNWVSAFKYNAVVVLLPLYFATDIASLFNTNDRLIKLRKTLVILIGAALVLLYLYRIANHFFGI